MPRYRKILEAPKIEIAFLHGKPRACLNGIPATHQQFIKKNLKPSAYSHVWEKIDKMRIYKTLLVKRNTFASSGTGSLAKLYNRRGRGLVRVFILPAGVLFIRITHNYEGVNHAAN